MNRAWILFALAACDPSDPPARRPAKPIQPTPAPPPPTQEQVNSLRAILGETREQSKTAVLPSSMASCSRVNSFAGSFSNTAPHVTPWWEAFEPIENFFLFECSTRLATRAPIEARASAYCAGVEMANPDWFGVPGSNVAVAAVHLLSIGKLVAPCLVPLFADDEALQYTDETAKNKGWTRADLAAAFVGLILDEPYELGVPPAERRKRRVALAEKVTGSASP